MDDLQFYIFLIVFQSYQDDGWVVMRRNPFLRVNKFSPQAELEFGAARSADQR